MGLFPYRGETETIDNKIRSQVDGQFIRLTDGFTHYQQAGNQKDKTVILVHGFSVPYYVWDKTFDRLSEDGFHVIRYDLLGRGFSDKPDVDYGIDVFERQLLDLIRGLGLETPVNLIGLSFGGIIIASFAAHYPEIVDKLVFIDPAGYPMENMKSLNLFLKTGMADLVFRLVGNGKLFEKMVSLPFDQKDVREYIDRYKVQTKYKGFKRSLLKTMKNSLQTNYQPVFRKIGKMDKQVLLIWGTEDQTVPYHHHEYFLADIPSAEFLPVTGASHIPHHEKPELVNSHIEKFLRS